MKKPSSREIIVLASVFLIAFVFITWPYLWHVPQVVYEFIVRLQPRCQPSPSQSLTVIFLPSASESEKQHVFALLRTKKPVIDSKESYFLFDEFDEDAVPIVREAPSVSYVGHAMTTCL
jgi:hypothetical protein